MVVRCDDCSIDQDFNWYGWWRRVNSCQICRLSFQWTRLGVGGVIDAA